MKAPRKLFAIMSVALAFALTQLSLNDAPPAPLAAKANPMQRSHAADDYLADNTLLVQQQALVAPNGGEGFPSQWQQLRASLDVEGSWRLASAREDEADTLFPAVPDLVPAGQVPEPAGYLALLAGLAGMALLRRAQMKHLPWRVK